MCVYEKEDGKRVDKKRKRGSKKTAGAVFLLDDVCFLESYKRSVFFDVA